MNKRILFTYGMVAFLLQGCVNEIEEGFNQVCTSSCVVIEGRFTTEDGTVGIAHLPLELDWGNTGMLGGTIRRIATGKTDALGYYSFSFSPRDEELTKGSFSIEFSIGKEYLAFYNFFEFYDINRRDTILIQNYHVPRKAAVKLVLTNPEAIASSEYISCQVKYNIVEVTNNVQVGSGGLDTRYNTTNEITLDAAGNQYNYIEIYKMKDGIGEHSKDSVVVPLEETLIYEIKF